MMAGIASAQGPWVITPDERLKHEATFQSLNPHSGFLSGSQAKQFFLKSKLPPMVLGEIWSLSDLDRDGKMTMQEFTVAMHLIQNKLKGIDLPSALPNTLKMSSMPSSHPSPKTSSYSPRGVTNGFTNMSGASTLPKSSGISWSGINQSSSTMTSYGAMPTSNNTLGSLSSSFNMGSTGFNNTNTTNIGFYNSPGIMSSSVQSSMPLSQASSFSTSTPSTMNSITPAVKLKYNQMFKSLDFKKTGYLSGEQARGVLIQSGLSQQALAKIWSLSDLDKDSQLNIDEFSLAMHFVDMAKQGHQLPLTTPLDLLSPAQARIVSESMASDPGRERSSSTLSLDGRSRSGSMADDKRNIFTFEDKRKENFEKGRLELERRRQDLQDKLKRERDEREAKERAEEERRQRAKMEAEQKRQAELEKQRQQQIEMEKEQEALRKKMIQQRLAAQIEAEKQRQLEWQKRKEEELLNQKGLEQDIVNNLKARKKNLDDELASVVGKKTAAQQSFDKEQQACVEAQTSYNTVHQNKEMRINDISRIQCEIKEYQQRLAALSNERERVSLELNRMDTSKLAEAHGNAMVSLQDTKGAMKRKQTTQNNLEKDLNDRLKEVDSLNTQLKDVQNSIQQFTEENARLHQMTESKQREYTLWKQKKDDEERIKKEHEAKLRREEEENRKQKEREQEAMRLEQEKQKKEQELRRRMQEAREAEAIRKDQQLLTKDKIVVQQQQTLVNTALNRQETSNFTPDWTSTANVTTSQSISTSKIEKKQEIVTPRPRPRPPIKKNLEYYKVMFTFDPRNPDEILVEEDQIVTVDPDNRNAPPGWLRGTCQNKTGLFPENYVEKITEEEAKKPTITSASAPSQEEKVPEVSVKSLVASISKQLGGGGGGSGGSIGGGTSSGDIEIVNRSRTQESVTTTASTTDENVQRSSGETPAPQGLTAVALYPYRDKKKGDVQHLSFNKGDVITIQEQQDMWWSGELNGKVGWFPKSYVKLSSTAKPIARPVQPVETSPTYDTPTTEPAQPKQEDLPILFECVALYPYTGEPTDLTFIQGDVISITKAEGDWWEGKLRGQIGLFPANYVKKVENEGSAAAKSKPEIATVITPYTATTPDQLSLAPGQLIKVMKKDPSGWWDGELQARGKKRQSGIFPSNHVKLLSKSPNVTPTSSGRTTPQPADLSSTYDVLPVSKSMGQAKLEQVLAMFPYTAQNQDELTFYKGSVINVISREGDWWKGEMNGQVGMFPSNYVQALSDLPVTTTQCK